MSARTGKVGPGLATMLVAGNMVGSGIFLLPATLASIGSITLLGWLVATGGALLIALAFARLAALHPGQGPCDYARIRLGRFAGFQSYLLYLLVTWVGNLGVAIAAVGYLGSLFPAVASGWPAAFACVGLIVALMALNLSGARRVCQFDSVTLVAGLLPVLLVGTLGWLHFDAHLFHASWNPGHLPIHTALPRSLLFVFWAFLGLESAAVAAAVVERPERNVAIASIGGVLLAAAVYIVASTVIFGLVPAAQLAASSAPFADASRVLLGNVGAGFVAAAALVKTVGTLSGWILMAGETGRAAALQGFLPRALGRLDASGAPATALACAAAFTCVMALATKSPTLAQQFERLVDVSVLASLIVYSYALVGLLRRPAGTPPGAQRAGFAAQACALGGLAFCAWVIFASDANSLWLLLVLLALAVPAWALGVARSAPATAAPQDAP
jgi:arginine:agmatine antiporter